MNYRELQVGEVIQVGDEVYTLSCKWKRVRSTGVNVTLGGMFRRPITPEQTANLFRERLAGLMEEFGVGEISCVVDEYYFDLDGFSHELGLDDPATPESIRESITRPETGDKETEG